MASSHSSKLLVSCYGNGGIKASHFLRPWYIAQFLSQKGWQVEFAGAGEYMASLVNGSFPFHELSELSPSELVSAVARFGHAVYGYDILSRMVEDEIHLIRTLKPNLILGDYRRSLSISARVTSTPLITITNASWTKFSALSNWSRAITNANEFVEPFNKLRSHYGLSEIETIDDALEGDITLLADVSEFSPTAMLPNSYRYIGPIFWEESFDLIAAEEAIQNLDHPIVLDFGMHYQPVFADSLRESLKASGFPCVEVSRRCELSFGQPLIRVSDKFYEIDPCCTEAALRHGSILITTGHLETVYRALRHQVPILGVYANEEDSWYIRRAETLGLGVVFSEKNASNLTSYIQDAINNNDALFPNLKFFSDLLAENIPGEAVTRIIQEEMDVIPN